MDIDGNRASVGAEDYSLITNEKCNPPRAKLFIVFLVSLVVATLIVLMVVLTRIDTPTTTRVEDPDECSDIAIVGAGLAGSYVAWQLRHSNKSIILYEKSNRFGGRFDSKYVSNESSEIYELGASFFAPNLHPRMYKLVNDLGLEILPHADVNAEHVGLYNLRGHKVSVTDLLNGSNPYNLQGAEKNLSPLALLRFALGYNENIKRGINDNFTVPWRSWLNSESLKDVLLHRVSYSAYQYLIDTLHWWEYYGLGNALVFLDYVTKVEDTSFPFTQESLLTVSGGMQSIIMELIAQTQKVNSKFRVHKQSQLVSVTSQPASNKLQFMSSSLHDGSGRQPCAKSVIMAVPPSSLAKVNFDPKDVHEIWQGHLDKLLNARMMRVHVKYTTNYPIWPDNVAPFSRIKTDLPIQDVAIVNMACEYRNDTNETYPYINSTDIWLSEALNASDVQFNASDEAQFHEATMQCSTHFEVNLYEHQLDYWEYLLIRDNLLPATSTSADDVITIKDVTSSRFCMHLENNMNELFGGALIGKTPSLVVVKFWNGEGNTDAFHVWKPGAQWREITRNLWTPIQDVKLHLVGSDYAPGFLQFWGEGALYAVEQLIRMGV